MTLTAEFLSFLALEGNQAMFESLIPPTISHRRNATRGARIEVMIKKSLWGDQNLAKCITCVFLRRASFSGSPGCTRRPPRTPGVATGTPVGGLRPTEGRAIFPIGVLRVSSNMVAGAAMQVRR